MIRFLTDSLVLAGRNARRTSRMPDWVMFATIQPIMFVVLFRYVFGGAIDTGDESYINFLMAGIFVQTVSFGAVSTGFGLVDDMQRGVIDRFRSLPMSHGAVVFGRILSDMIVNSVTIVIMLVVGVLVGFRPEGSPAESALAIGLLLLTSFSLSWIGATIGLTLKTVEAVNSLGFMWIFPITFVSSAFVPVETMPDWLQGFADNQPFTRMVDSVRALSLNNPVGDDLWWAIGSCLVIIAVFAPLSMHRFRRASTRA